MRFPSIANLTKPTIRTRRTVSNIQVIVVLAMTTGAMLDARGHLRISQTLLDNERAIAARDTDYRVPDLSAWFQLRDIGQKLWFASTIALILISAFWVTVHKSDARRAEAASAEWEGSITGVERVQVLAEKLYALAAPMIGTDGDWNAAGPKEQARCLATAVGLIGNLKDVGLTEAPLNRPQPAHETR